MATIEFKFEAHADLPPNAKFCGECGTKTAA